MSIALDRLLFTGINALLELAAPSGLLEHPSADDLQGAASHVLAFSPPSRSLPPRILP